MWRCAALAVGRGGPWSCQITFIWEFEKIRNYIEGNPVRAGLVREAHEYRWSSAGWATRGSPADQGVRPTIGQ
jgi:hypothetical protein